MKKAGSEGRFSSTEHHGTRGEAGGVITHPPGMPPSLAESGPPRLLQRSPYSCKHPAEHNHTHERGARGHRHVLLNWFPFLPEKLATPYLPVSLITRYSHTIVLDNAT